MSRILAVPGTPIPQPRPRAVVKVGGPQPRAGVVGARRGHPVRAWRAAVRAAAIEAGWQPVDGPLVVRLLCYYERPASHLRRDGTPRKGAPGWVPRVDVDNLAKSTLDALNGVAWHDDAQIVGLSTSKRYGVEAGCLIAVTPADTDDLT